ncbi:HotDog domain-containing protein [Lactifluus volemus]|nr:HotDog domain-containing protein [Lactifluus volemus]
MMFSTILRRIPPPVGGLRLFASSASPAFPGPSRTLRTLRRFTLAVSLGSTAYTIGAFYPPSIVTYVAPPTLEEKLQKLPILAEHRAKEDPEAWYETRPYISVSEERRANNLTAGTLRGPGRLALHPLVRARRDESESLIIVHVGRALCGHDGIVHGGLLATLLDESLARTFIVFRIHLLEAKGRKARVSGTIEDLDGNILIDAS